MGKIFSSYFTASLQARGGPLLDWPLQCELAEVGAQFSGTFDPLRNIPDVDWGKKNLDMKQFWSARLGSSLHLNVQPLPS